MFGLRFSLGGMYLAGFCLWPAKISFELRDVTLLYLIQMLLVSTAVETERKGPCHQRAFCVFLLPSDL